MSSSSDSEEDSSDQSSDESSDDQVPKFTISDDQFVKYLNEILSDVTFLVGVERKKIPGHKEILSNCSWEFYNIFNNIKLDKYELLFDDISENTFLCFLRYCYTGKVKTGDEEDRDETNLMHVLKLAYRFQMKHLITACETLLGKDLDTHNCLTYFRQSSFLNKNSTIRKEILQFIARHFIMLTRWEYPWNIFKELPLEDLREIVKLDNIEADEMLIFDAFIRWAKYNCEKVNSLCEPRNLRAALRDVFYKIRFPTMKHQWFVEILGNYSGMFTTKEISNISLAIMGKMKFCPIFTSDLRNIGSPYTNDPTIYGITEGTLVPPLSVDQQNLKMSEKMLIKFKCESPKILIGFAFYCKKDVGIEFTICKLWQEHQDVTYESKVTPTIFGRFTLSWDYDLIIAHFYQKRDFEHLQNKWFNLYCRISTTAPANARFYSNAPSSETQSDNVCMKRTECDKIPYLVFE